MSEGSTFLRFCESIQEIYRKVTPEYSVDDLNIQNAFVAHTIPFLFVVGYLYLLKVLPGILLEKDYLGRKAKNVMFVAWNAFLTVYSGVAFLYVFTWYVIQISEKGSFHEVYCPKAPMCFVRYWTFAISKYFELFDTILLIIKNPKRPPIFLHWYHHATVVFATHIMFRYHYSPYFFGMMMNTFVHLNMSSRTYFYYALTPFFRPPWAFLLTVLQISQMVAGCYVYTSWLFAHWKFGCFSFRPLLNSGYLVALYTTYCALFVQFMLRRYFGFGKKKKKLKKARD